MISYKSLLFIFAALLIFISQVHSHGEGGCTHDQEEKGEPSFLDIEENFSSRQEGRVLQDSNYPNMRIYPYYGQLDNTPSSYENYLMNELVPPIISYFQSALRVKYPVVGKLRLGSSASSICDNDIPDILYNEGVDADFFIFYMTRWENSWNIAMSQFCYLASGSKRPLIAYTNINRKMLPEANGDPLLHEKNTYLLLHETLHNLGFTKYAYPYFIDQYGNTLRNHVRTMNYGGETRTVLDVAPLTSKLRKYFGCSSIPGAFMENDGGDATSGSHFERRYFLYDLMTSGLIDGHRISEFSLALLEGSGWYVPDYSYAEPYFWGQGQGCSFLTGSCYDSSFNFDEFCQGSGQGCGAMGRAGGSCQSDSLTEGCQYYYPFEDNDCENPIAYNYARLPDLQVFGRGSGSKCFTGTLSSKNSYYNGRTTFCFKYQCVNDGQQVQVQVGQETITCHHEGISYVDGYSGAIDCPDPTTFCNTVGKPYCPRNCMGRGTCENNKCNCDDGFTGVDCALSA